MKQWWRPRRVSSNRERGTRWKSLLRDEGCALKRDRPGSRLERTVPQLHTGYPLEKGWLIRPPYKVKE